MLHITRAAQLDKHSDEFPDESPGPIYLPRKVGGIGPQALSNVATEPRTLIGTAPRFSSSKHADEGPGPGAYKISPQKGPAFSIRGRETFGSQLNSSASDTPGPGHVTRIETAHTRKANAPAYSIRGRKPSYTSSDFTPGPGHTQHVSAANAKQLLSTKPNIAGMKFGTGPRSPTASKPVSDAGPGEYGPAAGDVTKLAGYKKPPAFSMSFRHPIPSSSGAAGAEFRGVPRGLGKQIVSTNKTAPSFTMSGRVRFCGYAPNRR